MSALVTAPRSFALVVALATGGCATAAQPAPGPRARDVSAAELFARAATSMAPHEQAGDWSPLACQTVAARFAGAAAAQSGRAAARGRP